MPLLFAAALSLLCAGCVTPEANTMEYEVGTQFDVAMLAVSLKFSGDALAVPQQGTGVLVNLGVRDSLPELYKRYSVRSGVNGTYFMMPAPPMLYHVYSQPFYKTSPPDMAVRFTITNNSGEVLPISKTVCAFDIGGKTVASLPLVGVDVLPGHTSTYTIDGPALDVFKDAGPSGTVTVWLYGLGSDGHSYRWDLNYLYAEQKSTGKGTYIGKTVRESVAKTYDGKEERANADDSSNTGLNPQ